MEKARHSMRILALIACLTSLNPSSSAAAESVFVFSNEGKFIHIDVNKNQSNSGNTGYRNVLEAIPDPQRQRILLLATKLGSKYAQGDDYKIELLVLNPQGKLVHIITDPIQPRDSVLGIVSPKGDIILSLYNYENKRDITAVLDRSTYKEIKRIDGIGLLEGSTFSDDGTTIYTPIHGTTPGVARISLKDGSVKKYSSAQLGASDYFSRGVVTLKDSLVLMAANKTDPKVKVDRIRYIYDLDKEKVLATFGYFQGRPHILKRSQMVLVEEEQTVPNALPDGSTVGVRTKKLGKLHAYSWTTGERVATLNLPEDGKIVDISPNEKTAYYFSPKLITLVDLEKFKVLKQIEVPFVDGMVAIVNADDSKAAKPAPPAKKK